LQDGVPRKLQAFQRQDPVGNGDGILRHWSNFAKSCYLVSSQIVDVVGVAPGVGEWEGSSRDETLVFAWKNIEVIQAPALVKFDEDGGRFIADESAQGTFTDVFDVVGDIDAVL
jgi:hypothetical protein